MKVSSESHNERSKSRLKIQMLIIIGVILSCQIIACRVVVNFFNQQPAIFIGPKVSAPLPVGCNGDTWGNSVDVVPPFYQNHERSNVAVIEGNLPDSCSIICGNKITLNDRVINIDLYSSRQEDMVCTQVLTPFKERVELDFKLWPGEYVVTVNGTDTTTTFYMK